MNEIIDIMNPFKCEKCGEELQINDIGVSCENGKLVRICLFCGNIIEVMIK